MKERFLPTVFSALWLIACLWGERAAAAEPRRPNILFIVADDLRPDLGCYGHPAVHSPNIDRLASQGLTFTRAYCQMALCNPSRASVLTGRRPDTTRVFDNGAHFREALPDAVTLPQLFQRHGYHAQGLGKIYHHGIDDAPSWSVPHWDPQPTGDGAAALVEEMKSYYGPEGRAIVQRLAEQAAASGRNPQSLKRRDLLGPPWEAPEVPDDDLMDGRTAARAVQVLRELKDRPFFLAVGFLKPHLPFVAPRKYWDLYPEAQIHYSASPAPAGAPACALHDWSELRAFIGMPKGGPLNEEQTRQAIRGYRAATSYTDAQVGRLLDELDRLGLRESTIVVFWGDHGWQLGEHGLWCKHSNFEIATRAPLIVSVPGLKTAGRRSDALVELVDIYPTLAELCGLRPPPALEGLSFSPLLANPAQRWKTAAFSQYLRPGKDRIMGRSIRTDRWRYTEWTDAQGENVGRELYDERSDPNENVNLAAEPGSRDIANQLAPQLRAGWREALP